MEALQRPDAAEMGPGDPNGQAFWLSLDYCNALNLGMIWKRIREPQRVQSVAARQLFWPGYGEHNAKGAAPSPTSFWSASGHHPLG